MPCANRSASRLGSRRAQPTLLGEGLAMLGSRRPQFVNVDDARRLARRRLPRMIFDYVDGGARSELTKDANRAAFEEVTFRPRMAVHVGAPHTETMVMGAPVSMPLLVSPCGGLRAVHPDGDSGVARAAGRAGTVFTLSSASGMSIEEVRDTASGPLWFQLYFLGGRAGAEVLVDRAARANYRALVVTVDTPVVGVRERDVRNGMTQGPNVNARNIVHFAPHVAVRPRWLYNFVRDGMSIELANATALGPGGTPMRPEQASAALISEPPTWADIEWIRRQHGADGVVVSNHGGRQLDGAPATLRALPEIVAAVGDQLEIFLDGGVRRGSDVVKALALGARAVMIGRPYVYALGARGERRVDEVLSLLREELHNAMGLMGCHSIRDLDASWVATPRRD
ncbi:MAG: alpha-hydroxy-acid oxidizing protein [Actinobacteria bacterium]|nr:MAG: alpha-hydroxy-acid oxidizing protein [Actinomycetota bacterium]